MPLAIGVFVKAFVFDSVAIVSVLIIRVSNEVQPLKAFVLKLVAAGKSTFVKEVQLLNEYCPTDFANEK